MSIGSRILPQKEGFLLQRALLRFPYNRFLKACLYSKADSEPAVWIWNIPAIRDEFAVRLFSLLEEECLSPKWPSRGVGCEGKFCTVQNTAELFLCTDCWCWYLFPVLKAKQGFPHLSVHIKEEFNVATLPWTHTLWHCSVASPCEQST